MKKKITHKQYVYGDFDKDGTKNIDDKYPFDKKRTGEVNPEVRFSETLRYLENKRRMAKIVAKQLARKHDMDYRVKDNYSTINKLVRQKLNTVSDYIGVRKVQPNREKAKKSWKRFNRLEKKKIYERENKYESNKNTSNPYRAYHSNLRIKGFGTEAQFMSTPFEKLSLKMHKDYKKGKSMKPHLKQTKKLLKKGY